MTTEQVGTKARQGRSIGRKQRGHGRLRIAHSHAPHGLRGLAGSPHEGAVVAHDSAPAGLAQRETRLGNYGNTRAPRGVRKCADQRNSYGMRRIGADDLDYPLIQRIKWLTH